MTIETIPAGRGIQVTTSGLYMSVLDADGAFVIKSPKIGELAGKIGRQFVLDGISEVEFFNKTAADVTVEYEIANIRIYGSGSGGVNIDNTPSIQRIIEPISVEAKATFNDTNIVAATVDAANTQTTNTEAQTTKLVEGLAGVSNSAESIDESVKAHTAAVEKHVGNIVQAVVDNGAVESQIKEAVESGLQAVVEKISETLKVTQSAPKHFTVHPEITTVSGDNEVLPINAARKSARVEVSAAEGLYVSVGSDNGPRFYNGDAFVWECQAALVLRSFGARKINITEYHD